MYVKEVLEKLHQLHGKKLIGVSGTAKALIFTFDDGSHLIIMAKSGPGADSEWYNWTEVRLEKDGKVLGSWELERI